MKPQLLSEIVGLLLYLGREKTFTVVSDPRKLAHTSSFITVDGKVIQCAQHTFRTGRRSKC